MREQYNQKTCTNQKKIGEKNEEKKGISYEPDNDNFPETQWRWLYAVKTVSLRLVKKTKMERSTGF